MAEIVFLINYPTESRCDRISVYFYYVFSIQIYHEGCKKSSLKWLKEYLSDIFFTYEIKVYKRKLSVISSPIYFNVTYKEDATFPNTFRLLDSIRESDRKADLIRDHLDRIKQLLPASFTVFHRSQLND